MGKEPFPPAVSEEELAYYRAVEDHFARLRGTPFLFSPKDFAYLRRWWREGIPLSAVLVALGEVFARRRQQGQDPVSSLAYCRHAVARHARRLAQVRTGAEGTSLDLREALRKLASAVGEAAAAAASAPVRQVLMACQATISSLPVEAPPALLAETLAQLEEHTLQQALAALTEDQRQVLAATLPPEPPSEDRQAHRAWEIARLRALRQLLGLPRLELVPDGA